MGVKSSITLNLEFGFGAERTRFETILMITQIWGIINYAYLKNLYSLTFMELEELTQSHSNYRLI